MRRIELRHERQFNRRAFCDNRNNISFRIETCSILRDIIGDDGIQMFLLQFSRALIKVL